MIIVAIVVSIIKGIHFRFYNGKKRQAQNIERFLKDDDRQESMFVKSEEASMRVKRLNYARGRLTSIDRRTNAESSTVGSAPN